MILTLLTPRPEARAQKSADVPEDELKAAMLYNFDMYVTWPAAAWANANSPYTNCVLGDDSFAQTLTDVVVSPKKVGDVVTSRKIGTRKLAVRKLKWSRDAKDYKECTLLYIASSEAAHGDEVIQMLRGMPTLTVADFPEFTKHGGMINFFLEDSKLRFEVNVESARQSDLTIGSQILSRAKIVPTGFGWR
jgi:hypothetical protein